MRRDEREKREQTCKLEKFDKSFGVIFCDL